MEIYLVIKRGVYIQGIFGVYNTRIKAEKAIKIAKKQENDDYHTFDIIQADMNKTEYLQD